MPPPLPYLLRAWMNAPPPRHLKVWISDCTVSKKSQTNFWDSRMSVFRVCHFNKTNCHDIWALKNERIISNVKGPCLNRPDRFLQISVVCEFSQPSRGLMRAVWYSPPLEVAEPVEGTPLFLDQTVARMAEKNCFETARPRFILGSGWPPPSLIWRSESAPDLYLLQSYFYDLNKLRNKWWILDIRRGFGRTGRSKRAEIGTGDNSP